VALQKISHAELVRNCANGADPLAWEEFLERFHDGISLTVLRTARRYSTASPELVEDLIQETYLKLCKNNAEPLRKFDARHPDAVYAYLKVFAANVVHDHFKAQLAGKRSANRTLALEECAEPAEDTDPNRRVLVREIYDCLKSVKKRDRLVFLLHYRVGQTADSIARMPSIGLSLKGVQSALTRVTRHVQESLGLKPP
jgi:RNA polymerase sigma-70 factor (ECF subfamily)